MLSTKLAGCSLAAVAGVAMLALSMGPAAAFTLTSPSLEHSYSSAPVEKSGGIAGTVGTAPVIGVPVAAGAATMAACIAID